MGRRRRIAILGGGMAGLVTAWELSRPDGPGHDITVYQRGWRLGGKGASSRGPNDRIEEHGLHVLLGYYDATFRVMRECYAELARGGGRADTPFPTWDDAVFPAGDVGLAGPRGEEWDTFVTRFSGNDTRPGEDGDFDRRLTPLRVLERSMRLLIDFHRDAVDGPRVTLSGSPTPPGGAATAVRAAMATAIAGVTAMIQQASHLAPRFVGDGEAAAGVQAVLDRLRGSLGDVVGENPQLRRTADVVDIVIANVRGIVADGLLTGDGFGSIDDEDYRDWLLRHGASETSVHSPIVRGMYDLVFAYEDGDPTRPAFSAGLGLELSTRMLLDYRGSLFWKMRAGMGEVVFAPLYEALVDRGVRFEFFHRIDALRLAPDGRSIGAVELTRQAELRPGRDRYHPLVDVRGLACWPDRADPAQLVTVPTGDPESFWEDTAPPDDTVLRADEDFDVVVLAISLGMIPYVCADVVASDPRWSAMVDRVRTVPTQAMQLWLNESEAQLGWKGPSGVTLSGFTHPFDTWASMGHLIPMESWPAGRGPRSIAYFCGTLDESARVVDRSETAAATAGTVMEQAKTFLERDIRALWPDAVDAEGAFRWDLLTGGSGAGDGALATQHVRANLDPSDRYVQSVPGSDRHRLRPDASGYRNLMLAGDWTDCGLNAGCIEAATLSGILAARGVEAALDGGTTA